MVGFASGPSYESCLLVRNGKVEEAWQPCLHWRFTLMSDVACFRTSRTTYEASPRERGNGAGYNDEPVEARSRR